MRVPPRRRHATPPTLFFSLHDTGTTQIYTLSLHDALPICAIDTARVHECEDIADRRNKYFGIRRCAAVDIDRKSTRLNSSHTVISYAVFCLKKKKFGNAVGFSHRRGLRVVGSAITAKIEVF